MATKRLLGLLTAICLVAALPALAEDPASKPEAAGNAALQYWQAFGSLPHGDKDQEKLLEEWDRAPLDQASVKLVEGGKGALLFLHRAAKLPQCNWSLDYEDGPKMLMPHLEKARTLARLACLRARWKFHEGKPREAVDDVVATLTLGRRVGADPVLLSMLVGFVIERLAIQAVQADFAKLDPATLQYLAEKVDKLPQAVSLRQTVLGERDNFIDWMIRELKRAAGTDGWKEIAMVVIEPPQRERVFSEIQSGERFLQCLEEIRPLYEDMARLVTLPREQFDAQWPDFVSKKKSANVLADLLLPALDKVVNANRQAQTRITLLKAALAVAQGGEAKLKDFPDPGGNGPLTYKTLAAGFSLQSQTRDAKGELITFYAGQAPRHPPKKKEPN